jgi:hypothetical protein
MLNNIAAITNSGALPAVGDYESIQTVTVGAGGQSSISFTSIPATYKHLQIRAIGKSTSAGTQGDLTFNSDTGNNYTYHSLYGDGGGAFSEASAPRANIAAAIGLNSSSTANVFNASVIDILDYANTNKYKTTRILTGLDTNASGQIALNSGLWMNTTAVTSVTITARSNAIAQYSSFALYGIK